MEVHHIVQGAGIKTIPKKKIAKWLSEEALQIAVKRREDREAWRAAIHGVTNSWI